jgi:outer membrane biosynthesis protein TonB
MFKRENRAGIYLTISIHLMVLILFLLHQIHVQLQHENAFVLDFTKQEEFERVQQRQQLRAEVSQELDALLSQSASAPPRNVVVDASERGRNLRDDRFRNPTQVYDEHQQLQAKLDASRRAAQTMQGSDEAASPQQKEETRAETYKGPSVISYKLEGRKSMNLPIPVYKCLGGGDVTVLISVNPRGYVVAASVVPQFSSSDPCLIRSAEEAARRSRFSTDSNAPNPQQGEIVYRFIAQ